jgi:hypothetical protein
LTLHLQFEGFAYPSWWNGAYADPASAQSLDDMMATRANAIALGGDYFVDTGHSNTIYADPVGTESLANLGAAIDAAHRRGLTVLVKPLVDAKDGTWRGAFQPSDPAAFFASYKAMIVAEAKVAAAHHAELFSIGCEMDQLAGPADLAYWTDIIAAVRSVYSGKLTYAAEWPDPQAVAFWHSLDYAGVDNYVPLSHAADPSVDELVAAWSGAPTDPELQHYFGTKSPIQFFEDFAASVGKPLLFTELGYGSNTNAAADPADFWDPASPDPGLQAKLYQAFFEAWNRAATSALKGVFLWDWNTFPDGPGAGDSDWPTGYTPQGKPAQAVITRWFGTAPNVIAGTSGDDILRGTFHADRISGGAGNDVLHGIDGNDTLDGGPGSDTLTGGPGRDVFRFTAALGGGNVDTITDYAPGRDAPIELAHAVFTLLPRGILAATAFAVGPPHDLRQLIVYRPASGALIYDANGSGAGHATEFATLAPHLHLTSADFLVI